MNPLISMFVQPRGNASYGSILLHLLAIEAFLGMTCVKSNDWFLNTSSF